MIHYRSLAKARRELENMLLLINELEEKGVPKELIVDELIKSFEENQRDGQERPTGT